MKLGFNSNLRLRDAIYHVQTEDRGAEHPFIDTVVLSQGQVLHRRSTSYEDLLDGGAADPVVLRGRVERQHQEILEDLEAGSLPLQTLAAGPAIEVKVRNVQWFAARRAALEIEVSSRIGGQPIAGADVVVAIEGEKDERRTFPAQTNDEGRTHIEFLLPLTADAGAVSLLVEVRSPRGQSQIRYRLKPKPRSPIVPSP